MNHAHPNNQSGAALIVAMIILFMITILGVSSMQSANVETQLASNTIVKETTFQSAESATDAILTVPNVLADVVCQSTANDTVMTNLNRTTNQTTVASVEYGGQAIAPGYGINDKFSMRRFYITGISDVQDMNTSTTIVKGHIVMGAAAKGSGC